MKSNLPVKYFRSYLFKEHHHYKETIVNYLVNQTAIVNISCWKLTPQDLKMGEIYFNLFQLITVYNLISQKKAQKVKNSLVIKQKDMIVEIVRILDKHLNVCFPTFNRENFIETFACILYIPIPDMETKSEDNSDTKSNSKRVGNKDKTLNSPLLANFEIHSHYNSGKSSI